MIKNNSVLLSIIIPIYNSEKYLRQCLDSLASQLNDNIELVLINDGSIDNSKSICEEYVKQPNITLINQENKGLSFARNIGVEKSCGKYVAFVDSDDYVVAGILNKLLHELDSDKDVYISDLKYVYDDKSIKSDEICIKHNIREFLYRHGMRTPAQRYIVKKDFLLSISLTFPLYRLHEDIYWCNFLCDNITNTNYQFIDFHWYCYRQHVSGSIMSNQGFKNLKDVFETCLQLFDVLNNQELRKGIANYLYSFLHLYYKCTEEEKMWVVKFMNKNKIIFKGGHLKHRLFYCISSVFGVDNALKLAKCFMD